MYQYNFENRLNSELFDLLALYKNMLIEHNDNEEDVITSQWL